MKRGKDEKIKWVQQGIESQQMSQAWKRAFTVVVDKKSKRNKVFGWLWLPPVVMYVKLSEFHCSQTAKWGEWDVRLYCAVRERKT